MSISPREIEDRFEEAAYTLKRLPNPTGSGPRGYGKSWPEYVHEAKDAYGYHEVQMRVVPSAAAIQRMDECIDWLRLLAPLRSPDRLDACRRCAVTAGLHPGLLRAINGLTRWAAALLTIAKHLNKPAPRMRKPKPEASSERLL